MRKVQEEIRNIVYHAAMRLNKKYDTYLSIKKALKGLC